MTTCFDQCGHHQVLKSLVRKLLSLLLMLLNICRFFRCVYVFELVGCVLSCCVLFCVSCSLEEIVTGTGSWVFQFNTTKTSKLPMENPRISYTDKNAHVKIEGRNYAGLLFWMSEELFMMNLFVQTNS
jgi:hypothetical protein